MAGSRGLELQHSLCLLLSSADQPRRSTPHHFPACTVLLNDIQRLWSTTGGESGRTGGWEGRNANLKRSVSQVSISLKAPFCGMQSSPFRLPNQPLFRKRTWLTAADHSPAPLVLLTQTTNPNMLLYLALKQSERNYCKWKEGRVQK